MRKAYALRAAILLSAVAALTLSLLFVVILPDDETPSSGTRPALDVTNGIIAFWEDRIAGDPRDFVAYNKLGDAYLRRARLTGDVSDYQRAEAALDASLAAFSADNFEAEILLALVYVNQHRFVEATALAQGALTRKPNDPFALAVLGDAQLALGNYDQAGDAYRDILNREPGLATFSRYAILLDSLGDIDGAVAMWRNAIANDGSGRLEDAAWANAQLGHLLVEQGRFAEAEGAFQDSLAVVPDYVHALAGLAEVHVARADYDRAVDLYLQVTDPARNPDPSYVIDLGDLYAATGQDDQAARQYAFVETIDARYRASGIDTDLEMALFLADHDLRLDEALSRARAAYSARPSVLAADTLAWALYKHGQFQEALRYSDEALRFSTQEPLFLFHAGAIHSALSDAAGALPLLQRAIELNPNFSLLHADQARLLLESAQATVSGG